jgi:23S rRNA U2552 (ribose-2'-O)-methylase RlmE/FtsJ
MSHIRSFKDELYSDDTYIPDINLMSGGAKKKSKNKNMTKTKKISRDNDTNNTANTVNTSSITKPDYVPIIAKLDGVTESIFYDTPIIKFSSNLDYSRFSFGFHHFIHANKNKMEITKQFEGKKKVYYVMNNFERYVDNYPNSIGDISRTYFELDKKPDILSRGFYKLWEIFMMFDLIDTTKPNFVSAHLAEGPGSFIQATMFFRDKFCKKGLSKNDKYHAITLHPEDTDGHVPELEKKFVDYYAKESPQRFMLHKTYPKEQSGGSNKKDNGDLTNPKTIKLFGGDFTEKADIVTADGGFDWVNENVQEQEAFRLILAQIIAAAKVQQKGGHFICKFFETFSMTSMKLVSMLTQLYTNVYFIKPLTSRASNSEKYAVCTGFKFGDKEKEYKNMYTKMLQLLKLSHQNRNKIVDIFPTFVIPRNICIQMTKLNTMIANEQLKSINEIVGFIRSQNYYGDYYQTRREKQIRCATYWTNAFFPAERSTTSSILNEMKTYSITESITESTQLEKVTH